MWNVISGVSLVITLFYVTDVSAQSFYVDARDGRFIYADHDTDFPPLLRLVDVKMGTNIVVWTPPGSTKQDWIPFSGLRFSRMGDSVLCLTATRDPQYDVFLASTLGILHLMKREYSVIADDAKAAVWGQDDKCLYFTRADGHPNEPWPSLGTWTYNTVTHEKRKILEDGYNLYFASFDHCLYVHNLHSGWEGGVVRYNPKDGTVVETEYHGVHFDPSEKYYFTVPDTHERHFDVYERVGNALWKGTSKTPIPEWKFDVDPSRWLDERTIVTDRWTPRYQTIKQTSHILNIETGEMRRSPYSVLGFVEDSKKVVEIVGGGKYQVRPFAELEEVTEEMVHPIDSKSGGQS